MLNFAQENVSCTKEAQSQAYKFLFNKMGPAKNSTCGSTQFKEYNKLIKKSSFNDFVDNTFNNFHESDVLDSVPRLSTVAEEPSAYAFSFQEGEENHKSEFHQEEKAEMVLEKTDYFHEDYPNDFLNEPAHDKNEELNIWPDFQRADYNPCIVLQDAQEGFFQKECVNDNIFGSIPDESLEFESLKQSFETFAVPESTPTPEEKVDEWIWQSSDKTDDKQSEEAKETTATKKTKERSKRKTNSFALGRTCFRGMSNYFKDKFEGILKKWEKDVANPERPSMDQVVRDFICSEFSEYDLDVNSDEFLDAMITILHSQNYKKGDSYIKRRDFKRIRALLYCYSSNAKKTFVSDKSYAIIFQHFYKNARNEFIRIKAKEKYPEFKDELKQELEDIYLLSLKTF